MRLSTNIKVALLLGSSFLVACGSDGVARGLVDDGYCMGDPACQQPMPQAIEAIDADAGLETPVPVQPAVPGTPSAPPPFEPADQDNVGVMIPGEDVSTEPSEVQEGAAQEAVPGSSFPAVSDFAAAGPFSTTQESGGGTCTVHRPTTLGEGGVRHPILLWGNGTGTSPAIYRGVLAHWASHGFIVAAANTSNAGTGQQMLGCLQWVISQGETSGSPYEGKVDGDRVGASGHSQGGGGSLMAGSDPRVKVTAPLQPYVNGLGHDSSSQAGQTGPMFLMSGSADTIASPTLNQAPVFERTNVPVFWGILRGANHIATAVGSIGGYRGPATAWFRLHLMDDQTGRSLFYDDCGLCSDSDWDVERRDLD